MSSELSTEQQDLKNAAVAAEQEWVAHFQLRPSATFGTDTGNKEWSMEKNDALWAKYKEADRKYRDSVRDPNDYQEDDKVPADPQGQAEEDSYKS